MTNPSSTERKTADASVPRPRESPERPPTWSPAARAAYERALTTVADGPARPSVPPALWAYMWAERGSDLPVLPLHWPTYPGCSCGRDCGAVGKHPITANGKDDATTDPAVIDEWWTRWPLANIGVRPPPGIVVLDVDPRAGGDRQFLVMAERYHHLGPVPKGRTTLTGGGGLHVWLRHTGPVVGSLGAGIDVKASSGYLVMPGSMHESGQPYRVAGLDPIPPAPPWLATLLSPEPSLLAWGMSGGPGGLEGLLRVVSEAAEGERNKRLFWACCRAAEEGLDPNPLVDAATARGLGQREAERTAASAFGRVRGRAS